jgi:hypothetical protein
MDNYRKDLLWLNEIWRNTDSGGNNSIDVFEEELSANI